MKKFRRRAPAYSDLGHLKEDDRIAQIGHHVMNVRAVVGFIVDDEPGKPERYIRKLKERFPGIVIMEQIKGPVAKTITVKVAPPPEGPN